MIFVRSSFDFSVNHFGVFLQSETQVLVLHGFHVEVDRWDGLKHFAKLPLILLLLYICIGSWMLRDWLAAAFLCEVFLIVLRLVSVVVLWFALPAVGCAFLLPAVSFALLPAVGFALLGSFHHGSRSSMFFSCGPRTLVAILQHFHHWLAGCGSVSDSLTTGSLAVVPSVLFLQSHYVVVYDSVVRFWLLPTPLLSIAPLRD